MASKKLSTDTSLANSYKLSRGVASVARPSAPTIGTATDGGTGNMSVTFTASTLGPTASSFTLTSSSGVTGSGASSPLTLQEVATGTYTYSVSGTNANGTGPSSAASNSVVVASVFAPSGAYDSIATANGTGSSSTITFNSIPATYTHLEIRYIARTTGAYVYEDSKWRFNSQTSGYAFHVLSGDGATIVAGASTSTAYIGVGLTTGSTGTASAYGVGVVSILDYTNTNKNKTYRVLTGEDRNGAGHTQFGSGLYSANTNAISSITIDTISGNWTADSKFALYGIKGA